METDRTGPIGEDVPLLFAELMNQVPTMINSRTLHSLLFTIHVFYSLVSPAKYY